MSDQTTEDPNGDNETPPSDETPSGGETFTKAQMDAEAAKIRRAYENKYGDYGDLKKKAAQWDEHEEGQKGEVEKLQGQLTKAQQSTQEAEAARDAAIIRNAVILEVGKQGVPSERSEAALQLVVASYASLLSIEDGTVSGVEDAVQAMLEANDFLAAGGSKPPAPDTAGGKGSPPASGEAVVLTQQQKTIARLSGMSEEEYAKSLKERSALRLDTDLSKE